MPFSPLFGNDQAKSLLTKLADGGRDSHILLFSGPEGVGTGSFATAFAARLLGDRHLAKIEQGVHPDVVLFRPEGKTQAHSIGSIQRMINDACISPFEADKKVYIVEEADRMLPGSSNALLKILEEPPPGVSILLLTSREEKMLPTIVSRCSSVSFGPGPEPLIVQGLLAKSIPLPRAEEIARAAKGSFSFALEQAFGSEHPARIYFKQIVRTFFLRGPSAGLGEALDRLEKLTEKTGGEEDVSLPVYEKLSEDFLLRLRDLHYAKECPEGRDLLCILKESEEKIDIPASLPSLEAGFDLLEESLFALQRGMKPKLVLERLFAKIVEVSW